MARVGDAEPTFTHHAAPVTTMAEAAKKPCQALSHVHYTPFTNDVGSPCHLQGPVAPSRATLGTVARLIHCLPVADPATLVSCAN